MSIMPQALSVSVWCCNKSQSNLANNTQMTYFLLGDSNPEFLWPLRPCFWFLSPFYSLYLMLTFCGENYLQVCYWSGSLLMKFYVNLAVIKADARHGPDKHKPIYILCRLWALIFCLWFLKKPKKHNVWSFILLLFLFLKCHNIPHKK